MMVDHPEAKPPEPYDPEKEARLQTELLRKINGKLAFFVWLIVLAMLIQFFIFTFSL